MNPQDLNQFYKVLQTRDSDLARADAISAGTEAPLQQPKKQKPKIGGLQGFLANALPLVGGALGSVGGTFLGPVGTAAGGAAGSGFGEFLRQQLLGEEADVGNIVREGVLGAVPGVFKGVGAVRAGVKAGDSVGDVAKTLVQKPAKTPVSQAASDITTQPSMMQKTGQKLTASGSGLKVGPGVGDINKLDEQAQFMARKGFVGAPEQQLRLMSDEMGRLSKQVDDVLASKPIAVSGAKVSQDINKAATDVNIFPDLDISAPRVAQIMQSNAQKVQSITNAKDLNDYVKTINKAATQARAKMENPTKGPLTPAETAALATKRVVDSQLTSITDIAPLKQEMAQIFEINPSVAKTSEKAFSLPFAAGGVSTKGPIQATKGAASRIGAKLQGGATQDGAQAAKTGGFMPFVKKYGPAAAQQTGTRLGSSALFGTPFVGSSKQELPASPPEEPISIDAESMTPEVSQSQQLFSQALEALQAGDTKTYSVLADAAEKASKFEKSGANSIKKTETQRARDEAAALTDQALALLQGGSVNVGPIEGRLEELKSFFNAADPESYQFNTLSSSLKAAIAKARAGTSFTEGEKQMLEKYTPNTGDSQQQLMTKLTLLKQVYDAAARREYGTQYTEPQPLPAGI